MILKRRMDFGSVFSRRVFLRQVGGSVPVSLLQARAAFSNQATGRRGLIWDVHFHLGSAPGGTPEERMTQLVKFADRLGIDRLVVSLGFPYDADPSPQQLRERNDQVLRVLRGWPDRALGFVYLNPNQLDSSLQEFDRCVRDGPMVGVKLWVARRCNAPELDPIAVVARSILATLLIALGSVRVFQFVLGTTYGHAWYLFGVSTAFNGALVLAIAQLIAKSDPIE